jgi:hypothetical protein
VRLPVGSEDLKDDDLGALELAAHHLPGRSRTGETELVDADARVDTDRRAAREDRGDEGRPGAFDEREALGLGTTTGIDDGVDDVTIEEALQEVRADEEVF